jgi:hypothetical protein
MMGHRGRAALALGLMSTGCPDDGGPAGPPATAQGTTSGGPAVTSGVDGSSTMPIGMTGTVEVDPCEDSQVIPPPPVDCSGADGVLMQSVLIEDGGDDPSILEGVVRVEGAIRVNRTELTDLDFMACVQEVTGDVTIFGNEQLTNVDGLWSLAELTDFVFSQNDAIEVFDGLPNVSVIPGSVVIRENASLQRLEGFHGLEHLQGMGVDPQTGETIGGSLVIQENPVLQRIDGLLGLRTAARFLVGGNEMLCVSSYQSVGACTELPEDPLEQPCIGCDGSC